jgi:zinc protease
VRVLQAHGAVLNGITSPDATIYFEHLPAGALELALWLEADRMATLAEGLTQERLNAQRAIISQERHQRVDCAPFGRVPGLLSGLVFPPDHPYGHTPMGSPEDLDGATLEDVRGFFATFYVPGNAVLAVTGDVTPEHVFEAAERYFGPVPPAARPPGRPVPVLGPLAGPTRHDAAERVPGAMTALGFRLPANSVTDAGITACDLALRILAGGSSSRAHRRLVRAEQTAQHVGMQTDPRSGNSLGVVTVQAMPGVPAGQIEESLAQELDLLAASGPSNSELARARAAAERDVLGAVSSCPGRALTLAQFAAEFDDPGLVNTVADQIRAASPDVVQQAAGRWLSPACAATVSCHPAPAAAGLPAARE